MCYQNNKTKLMKLTSIDYANLLRNMAYKRHSVNLNKTQVNKLLFICYGFYLAISGDKLFSETPKAWPYGPVFPNVYKSYAFNTPPIYIEDEKQKEFGRNKTAQSICEQVVDKYCNISAYDLSMWSHQQGGPWHQTVYGVNGDENSGWNKEISDKLIKEYFTHK